MKHFITYIIATLVISTSLNSYAQDIRYSKAIKAEFEEKAKNIPAELLQAFDSKSTVIFILANTDTLNKADYKENPTRVVATLSPPDTTGMSTPYVSEKPYPWPGFDLGKASITKKANQFIININSLPPVKSIQQVLTGADIKTIITIADPSDLSKDIHINASAVITFSRKYSNLKKGQTIYFKADITTSPYSYPSNSFKNNTAQLHSRYTYLCKLQQ